MGISIRHLHIEYPEQLLFKDVSFDVANDELVAIRTEVLDGGTSLLKGIAGQLNGVDGSVLYEGVDLLDSPPSDIYFRIGFVYEEKGLLGIYNTEQNICLPLQFHSDLSDAEIHTAMQEVCELLHIPQEQWSRKPHELNDVQMRMVNLARALITRPGLLLIDELEGGMSDEYLVDTIQVLRERQKHNPMAIIVTTASDVITEMADRVYKI
ncbi:MAG: ATP-binding cassette domain-containing protein, partial [Pseudomonadales bacterium]|nr:ATP-binding cassette domain-containing protein [Pseudomonadales bacterium]